MSITPRLTRQALLLTVAAGLLVTSARAQLRLSSARSGDSLVVQVAGIPADSGNLTVFLAVDADPVRGTRIVPFSQAGEGSTVFLPAQVELLARASRNGHSLRTHGPWSWSAPAPLAAQASDWQPGTVTFRLPLPESSAPVHLAAWVKDLSANDGWGRLLLASDPSVHPGEGDRALLTMHLAGSGQARPAARETRPLIYQLLPRLFSNTNTTRKENGSLAENGSGRFADIDDRAIAGIRELGATHVWLTGVLRQATSTDYSPIGLPADDADLLKGLAGSPYAVRDYFDVSPDYAVDPARRLDEFRAVVDRLHAAGLKVLIDFVPNHVARSYASAIRPEHDFGSKGRGGAGDDPSLFFHQGNNFFYLQPGDRMRGEQPPLKLPSYSLLRRTPLSPTARVLADRVDGLFEPEMRHVKVTGNNLASFAPDLGSWYETVKLNYGFDYTRGTRAHPGPQSTASPLPDTWLKMDAVIAHWQSLGVDGFRCDMAHMVPVEFWRWLIERARTRSAGVFFCAEAYDDDPARVPALDPVESAFQSTKVALLAVGFDAVYDDPSYDRTKDVLDANGALSAVMQTTSMPLLHAGALRYAENHDEVRLASKGNWGGVGLRAGPAVTALLWSLGPGPVMLYHGQEVGEPAEGVEGFGGDDGRTSIFDYWSMPTLARWVNGGAYDGGGLSEDERALRAAYVALGRLAQHPALVRGTTTHHETGARTTHAFTRTDVLTGKRVLVVANLSADAPSGEIAVQLSRPAQATPALLFPSGAVAAPTLRGNVLGVAGIPPLTTAIWEL